MLKFEDSMPCLLWFFLLLGFYASGENSRPEWVEDARHLIGEKAMVRDEALKKLGQKFSNFDDLKTELGGPYRHYALDVAVAMKFPGVVDLLLTQLDTDRDGSLALAINALLNGQNHVHITERYVGYLSSHDLTHAPTPVVVAIVDFFTHTRKPLNNEVFKKVIDHPRLEVQQAGALYFTVTGLEDKRQMVEDRRAVYYPQVRTQLLMADYEAKRFAQAKAACKNDRDPIVQSACERLKFPEPAKKKSKKKKKKSAKVKKKKSRK